MHTTQQTYMYKGWIMEQTRQTAPFATKSPFTTRMGMRVSVAFNDTHGDTKEYQKASLIYIYIFIYNKKQKSSRNSLV